MIVALRLELLRPVCNELFLEDLVLVSHTACLFLRFIPLDSQCLDVLLEVHGSLLKDSHLLRSCRLVVVQLMHLIVVKLDVTSKVRASTFLDR